MNMRLGFWKDSISWPNDNASFVFLARAVHAIGKSMFGSEWTGEEPCLELMHTLPVFPEKSGWRASLAHDLLLRCHPEFNRQPRKPYEHSFEFTGNEWMAAVMVVQKHNETQIPGVKRFSEVRDKIIQLAEAGLLITAIRDKAGGDPTPVSRAWWNSERIRNRFELCQLNPGDPYGLGVAGDRYQWIFVTRESLMSCAGAAGSDDTGKQSGMEVSATVSVPLRAEQPANPQRRIAESQVEPAFKIWRDEQPEGYVPTESEDIAHMKQFGVGREDVRVLRKKFPRRKRGEKKTGKSAE